MLAAVVTLEHAADPSSLLFAAGFAAAAGLVVWIAMAVRLAARLSRERGGDGR